MNDASLSPELQQRVDALAEEFLDRLQTGMPLDRDALLASHADIAEPLRRRLALIDLMHRAQRGSEEPSVDATIDQIGRPDLPASGPLVRYFGDYEILDEIAHGGMGIVYKARQVSLNRLVALKMIRAGQLASPADVQRFLREAEAAANLDHPNIVPIYEVGEYEGQHYFSMKLIDGGSLARQGRTPARQRGEQREAAGIVATVARAVHYAHQRGILHRDLKPANILLDQQGTPLVTDFGLAKQLKEEQGITHSGAIMGTPSYMAPEQAAGERGVSLAADVYSLGAILYELLTGRPPFQAESMLELLNQVREREPASPRTLVASIDRDLATISLKCLEKAPARRYTSAGELAADLDRWRDGQPILARPVSAPERVLKWARRRPALAALCLIPTLLLIGMAIQTVVFNAHLHRERAEVAVARQEAEEERTNATRFNVEAADLRKNAAVERQQAQETLGRASVIAGANQLDNNDPRNALIHFIHALQVDGHDPDRARLHRLRIKTTLDRLARLVQVYDLPHEARHVAVRPDGQRIAVAGLDWHNRQGAVHVFDTWSGKELYVLEQPGGGDVVDYSPDGRYLLTVTPIWAADKDKPARTNSARVWDAETGKPLTPPLVCNVSIELAVFHPTRGLLLLVGRERDLSRIFTAGLGEGISERGVVRFYELPSGKLVRTIKRDEVVSWIEFDAEGKRFLAASGSEGLLYETESGKLLATLPHGGPVERALFRPGHEEMLTAGNDTNANTGEARFWTLGDDGEPESIRTVRHKGISLHVEFSPNGSQLLTQAERGALLWDAATGHAFSSLLPMVHEDLHAVVGADEAGTQMAISHSRKLQILRHATFSPTGQYLLTTGDDRTARLWDTWKPAVQPVILHDAVVWDAAFLPDGQHLVTACGDKTVRLWDVCGPRPVLPPLEHPHPVWLIGSTHDDRALYTASGADENHPILRLWDARTGQPLSPPLPHDQKLLTVAVTPDHQRCYTLTPDGRIRAWDVRSGKVLPDPLPPLPGGIQELSPPGRLLARRLPWGQRNQEIDLHDLTRGGPPTVIHCPWEVGGLGFTPDGRYLLVYQGAASGPTEILRYDLETGQLLEPPLRHEEPMRHAVYGLDGQVRVRTDQNISLWDTRNARLLLRLPLSDPNLGRLKLRFSPYWRAWSNDADSQTYKVWFTDPLTGLAVSPPWYTHDAVRTTTISHDQRRLYLASNDGTVTGWDVHLDDTPVDDLFKMIQVATNMGLDAGGRTVALPPGAGRKLWEELRKQYPERYTPATVAQQVLVHHLQLRGSEVGEDSFGVSWHLERLLTLQPNEGRWYARRARTAAAEEDWEAVVADVGKAIERGHAPADVWQLRGEAYWQQSSWKEAISDFAEAIRRGATEASVWELRANCFAELGRWEDAEQDLRTALGKNPDNAWTWHQAALLRLRASDKTGYQQLCAKMVAHFRKKPQGDSSRIVAWTGVLLPVPDADLPFLSRQAELARQSEPRESTTLRTLALVLHRQGRSREALPLLEKAIAQHGQSGDGYDQLLMALVLWKLDRPAEARTWRTRGLQWVKDARTGKLHDPAWDVPLGWDTLLDVDELRRQVVEVVKDGE